MQDEGIVLLGKRNIALLNICSLAATLEIALGGFLEFGALRVDKISMAVFQNCVAAPAFTICNSG